MHAHPDEEASSTGGVLARYAAGGIRTAVVTCTGGERGEIHNSDAVEVAPRLAEVRLAELTAALDLLGAGEPPWRVRKVYLSTLASSMFGELFAELAARGLAPTGGDVPEGLPEDERQMPPGTPDELFGAVVDIHPQLATKWAALQAHTRRWTRSRSFCRGPRTCGGGCSARSASCACAATSKSATWRTTCSPAYADAVGSAG